MSTRRKIRDLVADRAADAAVKDVRIGLGYTAVRLEDDRVGLAYTFLRGNDSECTVFQGLRPLAGRRAHELIALLDSDDFLAAAVGLAAANAVANTTPSAGVGGDVLTALELSPRDRVGMVGFFGPLVRPLRERVARVEIFEEKDRPGQDVFPASEALTRLKDCDIALITSTAIINDTIDPLLDAASSCRAVVLLGTSTPMTPEAFEGTAVSCLSGITVHDPDGVLRIVSEGGGTRLFKPFVSKWNVFLEKAS